MAMRNSETNQDTRGPEILSSCSPRKSSIAGQHGLSEVVSSPQWDRTQRDLEKKNVRLQLKLL